MEPYLFLGILALVFFARVAVFHIQVKIRKKKLEKKIQETVNSILENSKNPNIQYNQLNKLLNPINKEQ